METHPTRRAGRSLVRLVSAMVGGSEELRVASQGRGVAASDDHHEARSAALRELQALNAAWEGPQQEHRDIRWID